MSCLSRDSHIKVDFSPKIKATRAKYSFSPSFLILSTNFFHSSPVSANKAPGKHWIKDGQCFRSTQESEYSEGISHECIMIAASAIQLERRYRATCCDQDTTPALGIWAWIWDLEDQCLGTSHPAKAHLPLTWSQTNTFPVSNVIPCCRENFTNTPCPSHLHQATTSSSTGRRINSCRYSSLTLYF